MHTKLSSSVLWAVKRVLQNQLTRKAKIFLVSFPHTGLTNKPSEVRMGKGRGNVGVFVARVRSGDILYQLSNVSTDEGIKALKKVQYYLGVKTRIIFRVSPKLGVTKGSIISLHLIQKMPQLDFVTFPGQVFWLAIFFISF
tara:strand:+ start:275 stop:697 length:423 start_codon:yes stop_codon:yes gene_type:complete